MPLSEIHEQVLLCIFDALAVDDVESFTSINHRVHDIASISFLRKHRLKKQRYSSIYLGPDYEIDRESDKPWQGHPLNLVEEIRQNPQTADHVKHLTFSPFEDLYWHEGQKGLRELTKKRIDHSHWLLEELADMGVEPDAGPMYNNTIGAQTQHVPDLVDTCSIFAYLLTLTPNVTTIKACFHCHRGWQTNALKIFSHLARTRGVLTPQPMFLQKLDTVEAEHWDTEGSEDLHVFQPFIAWTSAKRFQGFAMGSEDTRLPKLVGARPLVEEVSLLNSVVNASTLENLIFNMPLRVFKYALGDALVSYETIDPGELVRVLEQHAGGTLEELELVAQMGDYVPEDMSPTHCDFRGFKVLQKLTLDLDIYFASSLSDAGTLAQDEDDNGSSADWVSNSADPTAGGIFRKLLDMLPESITELKISMSDLPDNWQEEFNAILREEQKSRLKDLNLHPVDFYSHKLQVANPI